MLILSKTDDEEIPATQTYVQRAVLLASSKFLGRIQLAHNDGPIWVAVVRNLSRGAAETLAAARARLQRLTPAQAYEELLAPAINAPTSSSTSAARPSVPRSGGIAGSLSSIVTCSSGGLTRGVRSGCSSSTGMTCGLAAVALLDLGLLNATDIVGGYHAWHKAGLR
ncbi:hypothetical protein B0H14DRAFT_3016376, partial [Mycena olivaceomarginata]